MNSSILIYLNCATDHVFQAAHYVMGIIHGEASYLPDFLDYFSTKFPSAPVKMEILGKKDIETTTMANFYSQVSQTHTHTYTHTKTHLLIHTIDTYNLKV